MPLRLGERPQRPRTRTLPDRADYCQQIERLGPQGYAWFLYGTTSGNQTATALIVAKPEGFNSSRQ
jgi:hypothetical protein